MDEKPIESTGPDVNRRRWLIVTSVATGLGGIAAAIPFADSLMPPASALAAGAPVKADIGQLSEGEMLTVAWRGMPVFVVDRSPDMLESVIKATPLVADPDSLHVFSMPLPNYCKNTFRSRADHRNILVVVGVCTHLGCTPAPRFQPGPQPNLPDNWPGGFLCPCHGSTYDLAGRVFRDKPAPQNLDVPRYMFLSPTELLIGQDELGMA
ncbi:MULTISPECIES: ubiquinol-cytochrome c reductase iron-sulfur subunit [Burkholderia cepacia complex]|uniref:ubiquinol-cytochrome c reductase iron-sulfur subunit n=1 Tax=Burkholderia cepacia complex TaxID=87882 RepID=UPI00073A8CD8|nr:MULTISPECIES: ubiquinol-cytochrome c reductase iron-sulfur subunit [Burkholderia cepacia complex]ALV61656.1 ubiquinol-cytochrome C reductase [Burkholderia cenocepacia]AQQ48096.1 ubiquinol-cytochrome c reductase iron-sulfur subunit [Burkholderia cenocepacia]ONJ04188.1 ubiquinol-cytochrome c reductase iron-sulfur subunit [Burkholderia cenocepacia]ONJ09542.1 ubiquinol-cytochrome c reductase iron-sulfur subunit [Burkholderia cenocepacia]ONJ29283.1 ubiquinol-cytochrome c reductase iron-sulfur su